MFNINYVHNYSLCSIADHGHNVCIVVWLCTSTSLPFCLSIVLSIPVLTSCLQYVLNSCVLWSCPTIILCVDAGYYCRPDH